MTTDQINPGYGYRLLRPDEKIIPGDEYVCIAASGSKLWSLTTNPGPTSANAGGGYRRKIDPGEGWEIVPEGECPCNTHATKNGTDWFWFADSFHFNTPAEAIRFAPAIIAFRRPKTQPAKPMEKKFDPTKPVQTRDGHPARIICADRRTPEYPIVALVGERDNSTLSFTADGKININNASPSPSDLINIPEKRTIRMWVNVYENGGMCYHENADDASRWAININGGLFATKEITFGVTQGEGL